MTIDPEAVPQGAEAETRWRDLPWQDRTAMMLGRRTPRSEQEARAALGYARLHADRSLLMASLNGVGAAVLWWALSALLGNPLEGTGVLVPALIFGVVFFVGQLVISRWQARSLEAGARTVLEDDPAAG